MKYPTQEASKDLLHYTNVLLFIATLGQTAWLVLTDQTMEQVSWTWAATAIAWFISAFIFGCRYMDVYPNRSLLTVQTLTLIGFYLAATHQQRATWLFLGLFLAIILLLVIITD
ncbi:MAG: hypothetical protein ACK4UP_04140 [Spirosomataceae bacterium]